MVPKSIRGQAMTEYIIVVAAVVVGTGFAVSGFLDHVGEFYLDLMRVISIPIP